jgi:hypothetical protein
MHESVTRALSGLPAGLRKTLTYDNGLKNALHERTNCELGVKSYFCKPYHSWEKGSIENRNGILRRYFPKKHNWRLTAQKKTDKVVSKINATPINYIFKYILKKILTKSESGEVLMRGCSETPVFETASCNRRNWSYGERLMKNSLELLFWAVCFTIV